MQVRNKTAGMCCLSVVTALSFFVLMPPATAQEGLRYKLESTSDGYVKLDTFNGSMTYCMQRDGEFTCKIIDGTQSTDEDEVSVLKQRIDALTKRIDALEQQKAPLKSSTLPSEEEFEQTMGMMERFMKRFMGMVKSFDEPEPAAPSAAPSRT